MIWAIALSVSLWGMLIAYCAGAPGAFIAASLVMAASFWLLSEFAR